MKLLTMKEVQLILGGRSRTTIYRDVLSGSIPAPYKLGARLFWRDDEINDFIDGLSSKPGRKPEVRHAQS